MRRISGCLIVMMALMLTLVVARGQDGTASTAATSSTPSAQTSPIATPAPTAIPLAEVVTQAETAQSNLRDIEADLAADQITATVNGELPVLTREIDARLEENSKILNSRPSLETLRNLENDWTTLGEKLPAWKRDLTTRATELDREIARLAALGDTWQQTLELARAAGATTPETAAPENAESTEMAAAVRAPPEILQRIETTIAAINITEICGASACARACCERGKARK